jgi:hypothetical protein
VERGAQVQDLSAGGRAAIPGPEEDTREERGPRLIPHPRNNLDRRVNRALELAAQYGTRQYVWVYEPPEGGDTILISATRPAFDPRTGSGAWAVLAHPAGWALMLRHDADEPGEG